MRHRYRRAHEAWRIGRKDSGYVIMVPYRYDAYFDAMDEIGPGERIRTTLNGIILHASIPILRLALHEVTSLTLGGNPPSQGEVTSTLHLLLSETDQHPLDTWVIFP